MYNTDNEYHRLLKLVLEKGRVKKNRTGIDTIGVFGAQARFNFEDGFPLLTTKKVFFKGIVHELLWFLKGDTNIKYLVDNGVGIWDWNCFDRYQKLKPKGGGILLPDPLLLTNQERAVIASTDTDELSLQVRASANHKQAEFVKQIKEEPEFAAKWGELGEGTYGGMWRDFPYTDENTGEGCAVDQIQKVLDKLKTNPDDRRMIVSAWHPYWVDHCALPPCHVMFHFNTEELTTEERWKLSIRGYTDSVMDELKVPKRKLNLLLYQRSCDLFLGVPFNIASYSLLLAMVAQVSNMVVGEFVHTYGDLHIYTNHKEQINLQLSRWAKAAPTLELNPNIKNLFDFKYEDIVLKDYNPHPAIKADMAV